MRGTVEGREITVGRPDLFAQLSLPVPAPLGQAAEAAEARGRTAVLAGWDGRARAVLVVADQLRPHAAEAVARIRRLGIRPLLVTGDNEHAARSVAAGLGIPSPDVLAGVKPEGKVEAVRDLQADGTAVALVGDGVNDAAALAQADLGMAVGTGADAAIGAADLTLVGGDPLSIVTAVELARATMAVIRANLAWASGYNLVAIPLAALGYLNPLFAGVAMSASSLIVVGNSLRLRRFRARLPGSRAVRDLLRAVAGPLICAVVVTGLLAAWAGTGGAGTLTRVRLQVTQAAVPMRAFTPQAAAAVRTATTFLTITNLSGTPDELVAARSPLARRVVLRQRGGQQRRTAGHPRARHPHADPVRRRPGAPAAVPVRDPGHRAAHADLPPLRHRHHRRARHRPGHAVTARPSPTWPPPPPPRPPRRSRSSWSSAA